MKIWVVGNSAWDNCLPVTRFPVPGETVLAQNVRRSLGGKGANQAIILTRFGVPVQFITALGRDEAGTTMRAALAQESLEAISVTSTDSTTDQSWIIVDASGENMIISTHEAINQLESAQIKTVLDTAVAGDFLLLQGNTNPELTQTVLRDGQAQGLRTVFNPAPAHPSATKCFAFCDLVILNQSEAKFLLGTQDADKALANLVAAGAEAAVLTLGAKGARYADATGNAGLVPASAVTVVDTTGAGDTLAAAVIAGLARGLGLPEALSMAMNAAAITVARPGTFDAFPNTQEAQDLLRAASSAATMLQDRSDAPANKET